MLTDLIAAHLFIKMVTLDFLVLESKKLISLSYIYLLCVFDSSFFKLQTFVFLLPVRNVMALKRVC